MARVFLSYSRQDQSSAKAIASALERRDHYVWWDRHLEGGSRYASEIEGELKRADAVVVIWSHSSVQSPWVQDEAGEGRNSGRLVPLVIDDSQPPLGFRQFQAIDLTQWNGRSGAKILETVHRAIEARIAGQPGATGVRNFEAAQEALADPRSQFSDAERRAYSAALKAFQSGNSRQEASAVNLLRGLPADDPKKGPLLITALAALGADREALEMMDKLVGSSGSRDQYLLFQPPFDRTRHTPGFAAIVERIGLVQYWRQSKKLPDFCRAPNAPALCRSLT